MFNIIIAMVLAGIFGYWAGNNIPSPYDIIVSLVVGWILGSVAALLD